MEIIGWCFGHCFGLWVFFGAISTRRQNRLAEFPTSRIGDRRNLIEIRSALSLGSSKSHPTLFVAKRLGRLWIFSLHTCVRFRRGELLRTLQVYAVDQYQAFHALKRPNCRLYRYTSPPIYCHWLSVIIPIVRRFPPYMHWRLFGLPRRDFCIITLPGRRAIDPI